MQMALANAISLNNIPWGKELIANGADVNIILRSDATPLVMAARRGYLEFTTMLLEAKANVNDDSFESALSAAAESCVASVACVKLLIAYKANIHHHDACANTPLHRACGSSNRAGCAYELIRAKASPEATNCFGHTPLARALRSSAFRCVELLLDAGAKMPNTELVNCVPESNIAAFNRIVAKRKNIKRLSVAFYALARRRIGKDMAKVMTEMIWQTRGDDIWSIYK